MILNVCRFKYAQLFPLLSVLYVLRWVRKVLICKPECEHRQSIRQKNYEESKFLGGEGLCIALAVAVLW